MTGHLYFIGIAGHTMRGLALAARDNGYTVTGLDPSAVPPGSTWLDEHGFDWAAEYEPAQLKGVTAVIVTGAHVSADAPVIVEARERGIPVQSYAEFFGHLTARARVIAVAGTHGKTTTTALIAWLFESAGRRPDYLIGIQPFNFATSVRFAGAADVVVEADEYQASALDTRSKAEYYHPDILVLTSVEHDHPDLFPDLASVEARFAKIVAAVPSSGAVIACAEAKNTVLIASGTSASLATYGFKTGDFHARNIAYLPQGLELEVEHDGEVLGHLAVSLYGKHNALNTLAAVAAALQAGLSFDQILAGVASFKGAYRRFNLITPAEADITVVDDYAHHPTEVATTIEAAKLHFPGRRIVVIFRPHTYSRTKALLRDYQGAFGQANIAYITDIEGAREAGTQTTVSGRDISGALKIPAHYEPDRTQLATRVVSDAKPGDVILCLTVSGYDDLAEELAHNTTKPATDEGGGLRR
ncbi:MAG TPA: UDP-N-acetylmuramate--L-alanine ligase [Candidatus Saccharimonadia bacterium]|nr:UDP-N-acetylmuramate--L-alanine ligase [Candidatus Saccharimonadia bacterium]